MSYFKTEASFIKEGFIVTSVDFFDIVLFQDTRLNNRSSA